MPHGSLLKMSQAGLLAGRSGWVEGGRGPPDPVCSSGSSNDAVATWRITSCRGRGVGKLKPKNKKKPSLAESV